MRFVPLVRYFFQLEPQCVSVMRFKVERPAAPAGFEVYIMNIAVEEGAIIEARTCGDKNKRVAYKFMDGFHSLCLTSGTSFLPRYGRVKCSCARATTKSTEMPSRRKWQS